MPLLLRTIRKAKWYSNENTSWLTEGELQADALNDLRTQHNKLSVWSIDDSQENLERVAVAYAANRETFSNVDYALFDSQILSELRIKFEKSPGGTPDDEVNSNWHIDLVELTASKLLKLAMAIMENDQIKRIPQKTIEKWILEAVNSKQLALDRMPDKLQTKIRNRMS